HKIAKGQMPVLQHFNSFARKPWHDEPALVRHQCTIRGGLLYIALWRFKKFVFHDDKTTIGKIISQNHASLEGVELAIGDIVYHRLNIVSLSLTNKIRVPQKCEKFRQ